MPVIVVPAFNEEANIPNLMRDLAARPELWHDGHIILVDDGSSDRTVEVARAYGRALPLEVLEQVRNQGPGRAFDRGFRHVLRDAAAVTFTCDEERRLARQSFSPYHCVERVVNYGTAGAPAGNPAQQIEAWKKFCPALGERPFLLFLGRIHPKKGVDLLLHAYQQLVARTAHPPALVVAGPAENPELVQHLKTVAKSLPSHAAVHWPGLLQGDAKWGALRAAEAFVLPSHQENFGLAVAESLAVGTPVLLSHQVNIWREIIDDRAGLAAPDTADGTSLLLADWQKLSADERAAMRARAADCYARRFNIDAVARSFLDVVQPFLRTTPARVSP